jgi:hypothetical protein
MKPKNKLLDYLAFRDPDTPGHAGDQLELRVQIRNVAMLEWDMLGLSNINKPRGLHPSTLSGSGCLVAEFFSCSSRENPRDVQ